MRFVVPYAAGGGTDITARAATSKMTDRMNNQPLVIDNRPGGNAMIGADLVAKAAPDGYTVLVSASSEIVTVQSLFKKVAYDVAKDLVPVTLAATTPNILVTHPSLPVKNLKQLIALAKTRPGQLGYASIGIASPQHLAGELLQKQAGITITNVPYKGSGPGLQDLMAGHLPSMIATISTVLAPHRAGKIRILAVTAKKRARQLPEVPTVIESGVPDFEVTVWQGYAMPKGTSPAHVKSVHAAMMKALAVPDLKTRFFENGVAAAPQTPEEFGNFIRKEHARWGKTIAISSVKVE
mgnify:CR=1 FL=1